MGHGHSHERSNMMVAHAGQHHALLTSHLSSASGNELDIFIETDDHNNPKPVAVAVVTIRGKIIKGGRDIAIVFEQAPADERPEGEGASCSHFVAKTPTIQAGDVISVVVSFEIDSVSTTVEWLNFDVSKYCHHQD